MLVCFKVLVGGARTSCTKFSSALQPALFEQFPYGAARLKDPGWINSRYEKFAFLARVSRGEGRDADGGEDAAGSTRLFR
jgi:hypothetical protein